MLMLMRSEGSEGSSSTSDCDDPLVVIACEVESDACPAACREDAKEDEQAAPKSGDLVVTAKAAEGKKALIGGTSDLDTLTFKTSEEVTISSITLERYGYSTKEQVESVQLEDEDGNIIADAKEINNKGQVKLTLKKDYKTVDGTFRATIVLNANKLSANGGTDGSSIGFKVVAAESTAKNLNLDDYDPYLYDLVNYDGSAVEFSDRNSDKTYNWEAGELYEVAKFRVKAPSDANILIKGFTLTDSNKNKIEADKYAKDVTVTVDGKEVAGLKWNINKDDELVVSFSEIEVEGKKTVSIAVNMSFNEEFDNFGESVNYKIKQLSNFNATDKKTGTRVSESTTKPLSAVNWATYTFKWGKVKLSGTKLGTVNAAANSTNVKVAEWEITVTEALKGTASVAIREPLNTDGTTIKFVDGMRLVIAGEEYDGVAVSTVAANTPLYDKYEFIPYWGNNYATEWQHWTVEVLWMTNTSTTVRVLTNPSDTNLVWKVYTINTVTLDTTTKFDLYENWVKVDGVKIQLVSAASTDKITVYKFTGLEIEKSGKVELRVDLTDTADGTLTFLGSLNSSSFDLQYEESREVVGNQMVGSISVSNIKAQAAKASLENKNTKEVELIKSETNRKVIFDGTYEAKKGAVILKNFTITSTDTNGAINMSPAPTFYVTIDGEEYDADWSNGSAKWDIDDIEVADGKSINVKVEIEVAPTVDGTADTFNIKLEWEDTDNNQAGQADDDTVKVKTVLKGSLNVNSSARNTVLLKSDRSLAEFTIKPSKSGDDSVTLDSLVFTLYDSTEPINQTKASPVLKVVVDGDTIDPAGDNYVYEPEISIPAEGVVVKVSLKSEADGERVLTLTHVNVPNPTTSNANESRVFKKLYLPAILDMSQEKKGDITKYNIDVEKDDSSTTVSALKFYVDGASTTCTAGASIITPPDGCTPLDIVTGNLSDTDNTWEAVNAEAAKSIKVISFTLTVNSAPTTYYIARSDYEDYFKVNGGDYLMVFSNK